MNEPDRPPAPGWRRYRVWISWFLPVLLACIGTACSTEKDRPPAVDTTCPPDAAPALADVGGPPFFEDVTASSGVHWSFRNGEEAGHFAILESLGGGVALLDYDGDGLLDLFLIGGGWFDKTEAEYHKNPAVKPRIRGYPCKLYRNRGNFRFQDVTEEAGLAGIDFYSHGAAVADCNRDGWPDLLVTGYGRVALFKNVPGGGGGRKFVEVTREAGLAGGITWATSAAWADLDGDGWPDLYVCQYVTWSFDHHPVCSMDRKTRDVCSLSMFDGLPHKLYRNNGDGTFTDVSKAVGLKPPGADASKGLGVLMVDLNGDSRPEVYVGNDRADNFLYLNESTPGRLRLTEVGMDSGTARNDQGGQPGSMGVDAADYDGSGRPSLWVTNFQDQLHLLLGNVSHAGTPLFVHRGTAAGMGMINRSYVGWGTAFLDLDHHGWEDLVVVNGHVLQFPEVLNSTRKQLPVLLRNGGTGRFQEWTPRGGSYFQAPHAGRGLAAGDLDNDGRPDLVISHVNEPAAVLRNVAGGDNHWLGVELCRAGRADVVGARVVLEAGGRTQTRFARGGGSYLSSSDRRLVFGLAGAERVGRLTVTWPDGRTEHWDGLAVDRYHRLTQGSGRP